VEQVGALFLLLDVGVNEKRVGFGVDIFHHNLETVEAASLGDLNFSAEALQKILIDNTIGRSEECKDVRDEVTLIIIELLVPVLDILGEINLFSGPE
jgi:hypothetical protein